MQKSEIRILIVEDDATLAQAIETALQRAGYSTEKSNSYQTAKAAFDLNSYHGMVVDCMLPQKSGIDLVEEFNAEYKRNLVVIFTSGIFKERAFANDAMRRTKARDFFFKPFDIAELVQQFDNAFASDIEVFKDPAFELLKKAQYSTQDKLNAISKTESIHGFDLPLIYSLLMDSNISGELEICYEPDKKSYVSFNGGQIDSVVHHDAESYFGLLLVERGFCTHEEVAEFLSNPSKKPIGQKLVDAAILSPHAVAVVQKDQMVIRLSKTIQNEAAHISFREKPKKHSDVVIGDLEFTKLLSDWLMSKVPVSYLKDFYSKWTDYPLLEAANYSRASLLEDIPVVKPISLVTLRGTWPNSIHDFVEQYPRAEASLYPGLHFLLLQRVFHIQPKQTDAKDFAEQMARFEKLNKIISSQNHFEIFSMNTKSKPSDISRAYHALAKSLHPDKIDPAAPAELHQLAQEVFSKISGAYSILNNDVRRAEYIKTLELGEAQDALQAESYFEEGLANLKNGRYRDSRKVFEKVLRMKGHRTDTMIFLIWALVREKRTVSDPVALGQKIASLFNQVPHEDRHSPHYFFAKGLHYEVLGDINRAYANYKHAYSMDPSFSEARKEMSLIKKQYGRRPTSLADDLSVVVTKLFKKKTG